MLFKRGRATLYLGLVFAVQIFSMQNCAYSPKSNSGSSADLRSSGNSMNGNGVGYDGMTDYQKIAVNKICPDGSSIETEIQYENGVYTLTRKDCRSTGAVVLSMNDLAKDPQNPAVLIYSGEILTNDGSYFQYYCMSMNAADSFSVAITAAGSAGEYMNAGFMSGLITLTVSSNGNQSNYSGKDSHGNTYQLSVTSAGNSSPYDSAQLTGTISGSNVNESLECYHE